MFTTFLHRAMQSVFLTAEWRKLLMANYAVEPSILEKYLPAGTILDLWNGHCYISLVGFMFLNTRVLGVPIPFHRDFEEVNLRFYVRFRDGQEWKRGTVFIKEIVPRAAITFIANTLYGEHYQTLPMRHTWGQVGHGSWRVEYAWKEAGEWNLMNAKTAPTPAPLLPGSEEEFITEHYWGYTKLRNGTSEYQEEHPAWKVYQVEEYRVTVNGERLYGQPFGEVLSRKPDSVFLAEGSEVLVRKGRRIG